METTDLAKDNQRQELMELIDLAEVLLESGETTDEQMTIIREAYLIVS